MSLLAQIRENGGLFRGGLIKTLMGGGEASQKTDAAGGGGCAGGQCGAKREKGAGNASNRFAHSMPGSNCANGRCGG